MPIGFEASERPPHLTVNLVIFVNETADARTTLPRANSGSWARERTFVKDESRQH